MIAKLINQAEGILNEKGFNNGDYIVSLQGPSIIFTSSGRVKLDEKPEIMDQLSRFVNVI